MFQRVEIGSVELEVHAVEVLGRAALGAVKVLHPAVQVWMLAPVGELLARARFEIDRSGRRGRGCEGVHIEAHRRFLSLVGRPEGRERKAGWPKGGMS